MTTATIIAAKQRGRAAYGGAQRSHSRSQETYGVSYRAPQLQELSGAVFSFNGNAGLTDPLRGNEPVNSLYTTGPNSNLTPETGSSRTFGLAYAGDALPGLRVSANWFTIAIDNYISIPQGQTVVDNPTVYPGAIVRAPPSAQDLSKGYPGPITSVNDSELNFGAVRIAGVDARRELCDHTLISADSRHPLLSPTYTDGLAR